MRDAGSGWPAPWPPVGPLLATGIAQEPARGIRARPHLHVLHRLLLHDPRVRGVLQLHRGLNRVGQLLRRVALEPVAELARKHLVPVDHRPHLRQLQALLAGQLDELAVVRRHPGLHGLLLEHPEQLARGMSTAWGWPARPSKNSICFAAVSASAFIAGDQSERP